MRKVVPMVKVFADKMRAQVMDCLESRKRSAYVRAMMGHEQEGISICLGPGRCMMPSQSGPKVCPFCTYYPDHRGSDNDVETFLACRRSGH